MSAGRTCTDAPLALPSMPWKMRETIGAATDAPNPPSSTTAITTYCGWSGGEIPTNRDVSCLPLLSAVSLFPATGRPPLPRDAAHPGPAAPAGGPARPSHAPRPGPGRAPRGPRGRGRPPAARGRRRADPRPRSQPRAGKTGSKQRPAVGERGVAARELERRDEQVALPDGEAD